jgi:hypothetical protein
MVIALVLACSRMGNMSFFASLLAAGAVGLCVFKAGDLPDGGPDRKPGRHRHLRRWNLLGWSG